MAALFYLATFLLVVTGALAVSVHPELSDKTGAYSSLHQATWEGRSPVNHHQTSFLPSRTLSKRQTSLSTLQPNRSYQRCLTPSGIQGHCRHLQYCLLKDFKENFSKVLDYLCVIEKSYVGVCCPDQSETSGMLLPPSSLAGLLPAIPQPDSISGTPSEDQPTPSSPPKKNPVGAGGGKPIKPRPRGCGVSTRALTARVERRQSAPGEWPWMAAILKSDELQFCGGVLITDRHVLSAAHCFVKVNATDLIVRLGEYDLEDESETRSRDFKVASIRSHKNFQKATYESDIAILKLHKPVLFNSYIWPVCLAPAEQDFENETVIVAGWGTLSFGGPASDVLREVSVPVWPQEKCKNEYAQPILDSVMCAGGFEGGKDACQGDSGGPLLYQLPDQRWATIGVVSWGIRCGEPNHPGVYTRVNHYLPWILENCDF